MAEYAILIGLIAVVSITIIQYRWDRHSGRIHIGRFPTRHRHLRCSRYAAKCAKTRKGSPWPDKQFSLASSAAVPNAH